MTRRGRWFLLSVCVLGASACAPAYVLRLAYEEMRILWRRQSIPQVMARDDLDSETREKLSLVLAARTFARDTLGFKVGRSYATLARVDGDAVAHILTAAYRDRLEPYTWRYPIVGRVPYRGFFDRRRTEAYAATLEARGLDTAVWPSVAFSTLGWFADPLLSSMLEHDAVELVTVVLHELTHAQVYLPSAAEFNESLANFSGHRAAIGFFCGPGGSADTAAGTRPPERSASVAAGRASRPGAEVLRVPGASHRAGGAPIAGQASRVAQGQGGVEEAGAEERCALAQARWDDERTYAAVLTRAGTALRALYAATPAPELRASRRAEILGAATAELAERPLRTGRYDGTDFTRFNNAVLVQQLLYRRALPLFDAVWEAAGRDLGRTLEVIADRSRSASDPFEALSVTVAGGRGGS